MYAHVACGKGACGGNVNVFASVERSTVRNLREVQNTYIHVACAGACVYVACAEGACGGPPCVHVACGEREPAEVPSYMVSPYMVCREGACGGPLYVHVACGEGASVRGLCVHRI